MKSMRNSVKYLVASFVMVIAFAATSITANAANDLRDGLQVNTKLLENFVGEGEYYTGGSVTNLTQTNATSTSVTFTWSAAQGAVSYVIKDSDDGYYAYQVGTTSDTTYTIQYPQDTGKIVAVYPVDENGAMGNPAIAAVFTLPNKISGVDFYTYFGSNYNLDVAWNKSPVAYGYEAVCYNSKNKKVQTIDVSYTSSIARASFSKAKTNNIYYVVVKGYILVNNGTKKLYGSESNKFYAVPQPKMTSKNSDVKRNSVNLKWKKVKGATSYVIYASTKQNSGYKKVATVKSNKSSYKFTKLKGKTIDTLNSTYYIKVVTNAKFGKKNVKSKNVYYTKAWMSRY